MNRFFKISNSKISYTLIIILLSGLIVGKVADKLNLLQIEVTGYLLSGIASFVWLIFVTVMMITKKDTYSLEPFPRLIIDSICNTLFLIWAILALGIIGIVWVPFVIWNQARSIRQYRQNLS